MAKSATENHRNWYMSQSDSDCINTQNKCTHSYIPRYIMGIYCYIRFMWHSYMYLMDVTLATVFIVSCVHIVVTQSDHHYSSIHYHTINPGILILYMCYMSLSLNHTQIYYCQYGTRTLDLFMGQTQTPTPHTRMHEYLHVWLPLNNKLQIKPMI